MTTNYVAIVLDDSGSVQGLKKNILRSYSERVHQLIDVARQYRQDTYLSTFIFSSTVRTPVQYLKLPAPSHLYDIEQRFGEWGMTALLDATTDAINHVSKNLSPSNDEAGLVVVITDGLENASVRTNSTKFKQLIDKCNKAGNITVVFQVPKGHTHSVVALGVPAANIAEWEQTSQGVIDATKKDILGIQNYYATRSTGVKSVQKFYVTTDVSNVSKTELKKKLVDVTDDYKLHNVVKEDVIKDFVEKKTKRSYEPGEALYQLMKPEKVQENKDVVIMEKDTGKLWGGHTARDLIGLPHTGLAKVTPGNHANYEIFISSHSVNRKLSRGTKILIRK